MEVVPVLPTAYIEAARRSEELRAAAAAAQQEAAASAREAARALLAAGLSTRDAAARCRPSAPSMCAIRRCPRLAR